MATFSVPQLVKQDVPKSRFNLSCARRSPIDIGLAIPIYHKLILPGDDFRIKDVSAKIKSLPFVNSLMGSFRLQLDWYFEPFTNLYGFMDNNETLSTKEIVQMPLWTMSISPSTNISASDFDDDTVPVSDKEDLLNLYWFNRVTANLLNPTTYLGFVSDCSLMNYLGFPARFAAHRTYASDIGADQFSTTEKAFDAGAWLGYWDIYRTFYTNKQLKYGAVYSSWNRPYTTGRVVEEAKPYYDSPAFQISQSDFDQFFKALRCCTPYNLSSGNKNVTTGNEKIVNDFIFRMKPFILGGLQYTAANPSDSGMLPLLFANPFCGLGLVQYRPDLFRSIILPSTPTMAASVSGTISIDSLRIASHLQRLYDLYDASGGQFSKWYEMQFDVDIDSQIDKPILLNTSHQYIVVDDVTATALTGTAENPDVAVGEQFGKINQNTGFRGVRFRSKCHGYLYAIVTLVPEVDYSNTINPLMFNTRFGDIYTPAMAQLGYEQMPMSLFVANVPLTNPYDEEYKTPTGVTGTGLFAPSVAATDFSMWALNSDSSSGIRMPFTMSVGRNAHWYNYMTDYNLNYGAFSDGGTLSGWTLSRSFMRSEAIDERRVLDLNMYVIPTDWDYFFAYQQADNQSWYLQLGFDIEATRPIPKYMLGKIV